MAEVRSELRAAVKQCVGPCGLFKVLEDFYRSGSAKDGRQPRCKECDRERSVVRAKEIATGRPSKYERSPGIREPIVGVPRRRKLAKYPRQIMRTVIAYDQATRGDAKEWDLKCIRRSVTREAKRFANEVFANLRAGWPLRSALRFASRPIKGPEEKPVW